MRPFRNNHKRSRYRNSGERNFKRNGENQSFSNNVNFQRKSPLILQHQIFGRESK